MTMAAPTMPIGLRHSRRKRIREARRPTTGVAIAGVAAIWFSTPWATGSPPRSSGQLHARIEVTVEQVHGEVHYHEDRGQEQGRRLDQRVVPIEDALHQRIPDAVQPEDHL